MRRLLCLWALLLGACGGVAELVPDAGLTDAGGTDGAVEDSGPREERFLTLLESPADLAALSSTVGGGLKYLAPVAGRPAFEPLLEPCYFQNMRQYSWHLLFLQSFPEHTNLSYDAYLSLVLRRASRRLWGGAVQAWPGAIHPQTGASGVLAYGIYAEVGSLDVAGIQEVDQILKRAIPFAPELLVFVPESPDQRVLVNREGAALLAAGVATLFPEALVDAIPQLPYSEGEGYGTLRIVPAGQALEDYGPRDLVIVESAPIDISVVAGLITKNPQNELGHVNLRLREKQIPNVAVPQIYQAAWARALEGALVHLVVRADRFTLEPARREDAEAYWALPAGG